MATIYDIAEHLGLSPSTVSRALSGRGYCKEETRRKILQAAGELDYAPDHSAKMLKTGVSSKILLAVPDICNPFYFDMIQGINGELEPSGYLLILVDTKNSLTEELRAIQLLREKYADGMIMVSFHFCKENIEAINRLNAPVVLTNKYESATGPDRFNYVYVDTQTGIREATEHFISQGLKRIAYVGGPASEQTGYERYCGYRDALLESRLSEPEGYVQEGDFTENGGYMAGIRLLSDSAEPPEAIVAANDLMAMGLLRACEQKGLSVPKDIALSGMDNLSLCERISPKLTSVELQAEEIGRRAAELLLKQMKNDPAEIANIRLQPRLVVRESSRSSVLNV